MDCFSISFSKLKILLKNKNFIRCKICDNIHKIEYSGEFNTIAYIKCLQNKKNYIIGVGGFLI